MKKVCFLSVLFLVAVSSVFSQGIVRGKVTDETGESLVGVIVGLKSNKSIAVVTDFDGNFSLKIPDAASHTLVVSYVSYKTIEQLIKPLTKNEVLIKDFTMVSQNVLGEVEVVAKQVKANDYYMENIKKNSAVTLDYISAETMKKTGDATVVSAVARVSGVSSSGGLITVRGIGDRYIKTTLNGLRIPTLDPLTNNIKLDLFPASLVGNVIISKTASPDLPGDWAGAYLSIETKDYPDKLEVNVESQFGYNAQSTFKDFLTSQRSSTDWLGFDTGLRDKNHNNFVTPNIGANSTGPTTYQEMVALGLGSYYNSLGIYGWDQNSSAADTYFKLGLVQLGLLAPASIDDQTAVSKAKSTYNSSYKALAFSKINPDGVDYNNGLKNNWNTFKRRAPINFTQNFSVGNQTSLFKRTLGYVVGIRYGSSVRYDPNGISNRVSGFNDVTTMPLYSANDVALISRETNGWSALVNLAYKLNTNNSVSFLFMPNYTGTNDVSNFSTIPNQDLVQDGRVTKQQFYEQRKQLIYQVKSEHFIAGPKIKIDFNASYTKGNSVAPDFKVLEYGFIRDNSTGEITDYAFGTTSEAGIYRYYRYLSDNILDSKISAELPIGNSPSIGVRKLKFGGAYQQNDRRQDLYDYRVLKGNVLNEPTISSDEDLNSVLNTDNFIIQNQLLTYKYEQISPAINHSIGKSTIKSVFAMVDYSILKFLRFSGGLRVEHANIFADAALFSQLNYKPDDLRRENEGGLPYVKPANINETNFLPSGSLIFKLEENRVAQFNFRLNYSQTVARPSLRELNDAAVFDNEFRSKIFGNSNLQTAQIKNYDFRAESYFKNGDNVSVSLFFKDFKNHIEMSFVPALGITWNNVGRSYVRGIELEGKKSLGKHFELRANVTLAQSNSQVIRKVFKIESDGSTTYIPIDTVNRPMLGQAPYIVNGIFVYKADSIGLTATLSYNVQGSRLVIAGVTEDVYELRRHLVDFKISKTLGKHFSTSITVRDILNAPVWRQYKLYYNDTEKPDFDKFRYGTNYLLSLAYKF
jgi:hypothetical protein